jgi:hypothetical protein
MSISAARVSDVLRKVLKAWYLDLRISLDVISTGKSLLSESNKSSSISVNDSDKSVVV